MEGEDVGGGIGEGDGAIAAGVAEGVEIAGRGFERGCDFGGDAWVGGLARFSFPR